MVFKVRIVEFDTFIFKKCGFLIMLNIKSWLLSFKLCGIDYFFTKS